MVIEKKYAMVTGSLLVVLFGYIYIILQPENYALLAGSLALFMIIALIMYLTRNVNW